MEIVFTGNVFFRHIGDLPLFIEQIAFVIKLLEGPPLAAEIVSKILRQLKAKLSVKPKVRLVGIYHKHVLAFLLISSGEQCSDGALAAAAFSAKYDFHMHSPLFMYYPRTIIHQPRSLHTIRKTQIYLKT